MLGETHDRRQSAGGPGRVNMNAISRPRSDGAAIAWCCLGGAYSTTRVAGHILLLKDQVPVVRWNFTRFPDTMDPRGPKGK